MEILLIEDDPLAREAVTDGLRDGGFRISVAEDARRALILLDAGLHPDVILLDMVMPGLDGFAFLREQERHPHAHSVPVVVITANALIPPTVKVAGVVRKPFRIEELRAAIEAAVDSTKHAAH